MTTERITVNAADLQPGDKVHRGPWRGDPHEGMTVKEVGSVTRVKLAGPLPLSAVYQNYSNDTEFTVDRPVPTVMVELPRRYVNGAAHSQYAGPLAEACRAALASEVPTELKVGDRVRKQRFDAGQDGGASWHYREGTTATVRRLHGAAPVVAVIVDGEEDPWFKREGRTWAKGSFEVIG